MMIYLYGKFDFSRMFNAYFTVNIKNYTCLKLKQIWDNFAIKLFYFFHKLLWQLSLTSLQL